ncbi:uncharacterized protein UHOD_03499 [Ustilago sp. UG-2017b]|nr:uncharacterized protein UHOD_03499 [Ustilago sp. UG-2017b]
MLRRIASRTLREPLLRPSFPGPQPTAATSAAVLSYQYQILQQSRGLVSSVLLSSTRDAYESKKLAELKAELKSRGLAYSGRKEDLIKRLIDHDSYINGSTANMSEPGARPQLRKKSTLASLRSGEQDAAKKKDSPVPPAPTSLSGHATIKGKPPTADGAKPQGPTVEAATAKAVAEASKPLGSMKEFETPANLEPGTVHNAAADGLAGDTTAKASPSRSEEEPAEKTTPPGLPPQKAPPAKETFNIQIPYYPDPPAPGAQIPVVTSYASPYIRQSEAAEPTERSPFMPKAISVSASSAISHASDMADHATTEDDKSRKANGILSDILADLQASIGSSGSNSSESAKSSLNKSVDVAKSAFSSVAEQAKGALASAAGESSTSGSSSSFSSSSSSSSSSKSANRPLNDEERTGAYVLAGIVVGGFVLGGLGKSNKSKDNHDDHHHHSNDNQKSNSGKTADAEGKTVVNKVVPVAAVPRGDGANKFESNKPTGSSFQSPAGSETLAPIMCVPKGTQLSTSTGVTGTIAAEGAATLARLAQLSTCEVSTVRP